MNRKKGIIGALGGAVTGYAAGKVAGIDSMQQMNTTLLSHVLDQKIAEFRHGLDVKMEDVKFGNTLARDEKYIEGLIGRDKTNAELDLEKAKVERGWEQEDSGTEFERQKELARFRAGLRPTDKRTEIITGEDGVPRLVNLDTGESKPLDFRQKANTDEQKKQDEYKKKKFMAMFGVTEDGMGGVVSEPLTAEQKAKAESVAEEMGLSVLFDPKKDGGFWGSREDAHVIKFVEADPMKKGGIIGSQAPQGQAIGAGQQRSQNDPLGEQIAKIKKQASSVQGKPNLEIEPSDQAKPQSEAGRQKKTYERGSYTEAPTAEQRQEAMQEWAALGEKTKEHLDDAAKQTMNKGYELGIITNKGFWELARMSKDQIMRLVEWQKQAQRENPLPATRR